MFVLTWAIILITTYYLSLSITNTWRNLTKHRQILYTTCIAIMYTIIAVLFGLYLDIRR